jgi:hypothetical protein
MLRTTYRGGYVREPYGRSIHDEEAAEEIRCAYCDACEVTNPGEFCSDECEEAAKADRAADDACDAQREAEV